MTATVTIDPSRRICVCVSGTGTNLRALVGRMGKGPLAGVEIALVLADRECPALEFARERGLATALVRPVDHPDRGAWDRAMAATLVGAGADWVVLAGFMRVVGRAVLAAFPGRLLNLHPSLLPSFPGGDAIGDALAAGARVTGVTVHLVDETLDGGPIVAQEAVPVLPGDDRRSLAARIHAVEHRLLPRCVALAVAGALRVEGRRVTVDASLAADLPVARRALLSVSDKTGLLDLARGLAAEGFELVSTGGTARALREAGLAVSDVADVTGFPEMLDGRVKTLHPRVAAGVLADLRLGDHRTQLAAAAIEPFELIVVNLYQFARAAARPGVTQDELIEEIDIGGPTLVRAAAKNHASVGIVTDPADYEAVLDELRAEGAISTGTRRRLALAAFHLTAAYDATISAELGRRLGAPDAAPASTEGRVPSEAPAPTGPPASTEGPETIEPPAPTDAPAEPFPDRLALELHLADRLRYGENPHQAAALYLLPRADPSAGPLATGARPMQGKPLSYNNLLDASAAAGLARDLRGAAVVIVKHTNPCGAAEAPDLPTAWQRALEGDPVSAFGGVVAVRGIVDGVLAERLAAIFLEVVVAAGFDETARSILAARPNVRLLEDPSILLPPRPGMELRSAGGAILATEADVAPDDPSAWRPATSRLPDERQRADLDLAWRVCRHVKSNAIVLARDGALVGVGAGQMSRVDSARLAVSRAGGRAQGAACASDAFFPFPDAVEVCLAAGVTAFVQPGGSQRDAEVTAAAERAGAAMLLTGTRHFRH